MRTHAALLISVSVWAFAQLFLFAPSVSAEEIHWVDFSGWPVESLSETNLSSTSGLTLDATFSNTSNMRGGKPESRVAVIDDPAWPFDNNDVSNLTVLSQQGTTLTTTLTFEFTSTGGLPSGGSIAIIDFEFTGSSVKLTGLQNGQPVPVNWQVAFYQTDGVDVTPPVWDPVTSTLVGSGQGHSTTNNFAFLVIDTQLDAVVLDITAEDGDGVQFAVAAESVPPPIAVPTVSEWGMISFFILLVGSALWVIRHKQGGEST